MNDIKVQRNDDIILLRIEYESMLRKLLKYELLIKNIISIINKGELGYRNDVLLYNLDNLKPLIEILFVDNINERLYVLNDSIANGEENEQI